MFKKLILGLALIGGCYFLYQDYLKNNDNAIKNSIAKQDSNIIVETIENTVKNPNQNFIEANAKFNPDQYVILINQAVDAWFFMHLNNYDSYKAISRKTDYDNDSNLYTQEIKYRAMNKNGGIETHIKTFQIKFELLENGQFNYDVKDLSEKNSTEI